MIVGGYCPVETAQTLGYKQAVVVAEAPVAAEDCAAS